MNRVPVRNEGCCLLLGRRSAGGACRRPGGDGTSGPRETVPTRRAMMTHPTRAHRTLFGAALACAVSLCAVHRDVRHRLDHHPRCSATRDPRRADAPRTGRRGRSSTSHRSATAAIPGILDIFAAQKLGYFSSECLNVSIVANSFTSTPLVSADTAQFTSTGRCSRRPPLDRRRVQGRRRRDPRRHLDLRAFQPIRD